MPESVQDRPSTSHEYVFLLSKSKHYFYDNEAVKEPSVYPQDNRKARANKEQKRFPTEEIAGVREGSQTYPKRNLRSVWAINTHGFSGAHFATFPLALVEPCILAGTSAKGCCPVCKTPWQRVVEKCLVDTKGWGPAKKDHTGTGGLQGSQSMIREGKGCAGTSQVSTTGWRPTCNCYPRTDEWVQIPRQRKDETNDDYQEHIAPALALRKELLAYWEPMEVIPCVCLDPFAGSGTTGMVAIKHRREFVGLDLNGNYLHDLATERLSDIQVELL